jgi:hypothetical protein
MEGRAVVSHHERHHLPAMVEAGHSPGPACQSEAARCCASRPASNVLVKLDGVIVRAEIRMPNQVASRHYTGSRDIGAKV